MTVPVQRGSTPDDRVTGLILGAIDDLKDHVVRLEERVTQRVEALAHQFVPRTEYESRHSDVRNEITKTDARVEAVAAKLDARVDSEITRIESRLDAEAADRKALEEKLTGQRRFAYSATATGLLIVIGLLSLILTNLPH